MRQRPISRDEVRFDGSRITTMPLDSVSEGEWRREPIAHLWAPLLRTLNHKLRADWEAGIEQRAAAESAGTRGFKKPEPIHVPRPYQFPCTCRHCGREFYRINRGNSRYCSDVCATASRAEARTAWATRMVAARSQARAEARADLHCLHCGKSIEAQRSTRRYCNDSCRIVAHRERQKERE